MKASLPAQQLAATWKQIEAGLGHYQEVESVAREGSVVVLTTRFDRARLAFRVSYSADEEIDSLFIQPAASDAPWEPPAYAHPAAFRERKVEVGTSPALPGTLTVPLLPGRLAPVPAVVLVHGSGPQDEDEAIAGTRPFKDLAWGLASRGIAVLRYTKRSRIAPAGIVSQRDEVEHAVHDALALLRQEPELDPSRLYVLGHSQGGYLAPRIAEQESVRGLVLLAGPTIPLEDSLVNQLTYLASLDPANAAWPGRLVAARAFREQVRNPSLRAAEHLVFPIGGVRLPASYFLDVRGYDPVATAARLSCRLLVLQGERDYQVTPAELDTWKRGLGAKTDATCTLYPGLNHLFVRGEGPPSPAEYARPGLHVDEQVVVDIATWITA